MAASSWHPYKSASDLAFWSRAVATGWDPSRLLDTPDLLIRQGEKVVSAGSCFAANIIPHIEKAGLTYLRTEQRHPAFPLAEPEPLGYADFSAAYGNIYTARQLLQLLQRCLDLFAPVEDRWVIGDDVVDTLRPGLRYRARSHREFDLLTAQHLRLTREAFAAANVFVFTLGLTEAWTSCFDGTVFPACPGTVAGRFDATRHQFKNFTVSEIVADLSEFIRLLRGLNPQVRLIITVSPVPLVATATGGHVLNATTYSKSVLRVAAQEVAGSHPGITYFPAYEIITGPQAPANFFEANRRSVSEAGVAAVMAALLAHCEVNLANDIAEHAAPSQPQSGRNGPESAAAIARAIIQRECEEAMADPALRASPPVETQEEAEPAPSDGGDRGLSSEMSHVLVSDSSPHAAAAPEPAVEDVRLNELMSERDALAAEARRWYEAVIAVNADHHPPMRTDRNGSWWSRLSRRVVRGLRGPSPLALAARARDAQRWELAVRYYRDALDLDPDEAWIWDECGDALRASGKTADAETAHRRARELSARRQ